MTGFYPEDPLAPEQWHLQRLGNLARIWAEFTGAGIHVGVYDDGIQYSHHDLDGNYDASRHVVVGGITLDGVNALPVDSHGTSVAGLIAAEANGEGTVGIAFGASITGVNIFDATSAAFINAVDPQGFYQAIAQASLFDVVNHSWGATPGFNAFQSLDIAGNFTALTLAGWEDGAANGRGGLGTVVVKSAGNDYRNAQGEGLSSSRLTITVSAIGDSGFASSYSNHGASVLVGASGSEFVANGGLGIVTTDLLGEDGYNLRADAAADSDTTDDFGGTSAAAPIVSAVVALMLDANAGLGWRDVQNILAASATHTGSAFGAVSIAGTFEDGFWTINKADNWNGGGMHTHANYGHGALNAYNAVRMAEVWTLFAPAQTSANEEVVTSGTIASGATIPEFGMATVTMDLAAALEIEHVALTVTFTHADFIDIDLYLTSAEGTVVRLLDGSSGNSALSATSLTWTFGIDVLRGENLAGTWTVTFDDVETDNQGTVTSVSLAAYGRAIPVDDVFHFTDEFAMMASLSGQAGRRTITDTDGGTDWINAAAVTTGSVINLNQKAYSSIAGGSTRIADGSVIENAIGGDGDDLLIGNAAGNELRGMRGVDTMRGGAGNDLYVVDNAADVVTEATGGGSDTVRASASYALGTATEVEALESTDSLGGAALDLTGNAVSQAIRGNAAGNTLQGLAGADTLHGFGGNDTLIGGDDNDTLDGGGGNDRLDGGAGVNTVTYASFSAAITVDLGLATAQNTGGGGTDTLVNVQNATGTDLNDSLVGSNGANVLDGGAGNDGFRGNAGNDTIIGGLGNDTINGGAGADSLVGGDGVDLLSFTTASAGVIADFVSGGSAGDAAGDVYLGFERMVGSGSGDTLRADGGANRLDGGGGNDLLEGHSGADTLRGDAGNDTLDGGDGDDTLDGGAGVNFASYASASSLVSVSLAVVTAQNTGGAGIDLLVGIQGVIGSGFGDALAGSSGNDIVDGGAGSDGLRGNAGADTILGGLGNDTITGGLGADSISGGDGSDLVSFTTATTGVIADFLSGGSGGEAAGDVYIGMERMTGSGFADTLRGDALANRLDGGNGHDRLEGRAGADTLRGDAGDDTMVGGDDVDRLQGMAGNDTFVWNAVSETLPSGPDVVTDWNLGDLLDLSGIDADAGVAGNQGFTFGGTTATPTLAAAGQIFVFQSGGSTFASGGVDADGLRDLLIELTGLHSLNAASFIL